MNHRRLGEKERDREREGSGSMVRSHKINVFSVRQIAKLIGCKFRIYHRPKVPGSRTIKIC